MIDAMPSILKTRPDAVYVVLGATHPNLVRDQGEAYRESLVAHAREAGVEDHVVFLDQFVDQKTLLEFISMCDVYVTPYLNEAQMTSGTLAYSFGLGKAVVSTPIGMPANCWPTAAAFWFRSATPPRSASRSQSC